MNGHMTFGYDSSKPKRFLRDKENRRKIAVAWVIESTPDSEADLLDAQLGFDLIRHATLTFLSHKDWSPIQPYWLAERPHTAIPLRVRDPFTADELWEGRE
jgi:hypothetical protein